MAATQSRLAQYERKRAIKTAIWYLLLTGVVLFALSRFGPDAVATVSSIFIHNSAETVTNDSALIAPPSINPLPEITNKEDIVVEGRAESGTTVRITFNGEKRDTIANTQGVWSSEFKLHDKENTIRARVVDAFGNTSREVSVNVSLDSIAPKLEIQNPQNEASFSGKKQQILTVNGVSEADAAVTINDRVAIVNANGEFSLIFTLNDGENEFKIVSIDRAGNKTEEIRKVTYAS